MKIVFEAIGFGTCIAMVLAIALWGISFIDGYYKMKKQVKFLYDMRKKK